MITTRTITPEELGLDRYPLSHVTGGDPRRSAEIIRRVFDGEQGARRNIVLANAGACFYVSGKSHTLEEGVQLAAQIIDSGLAREKLQELAGYTEAIGS